MFHVEDGDLLTFAHDDLVGRTRQRQGFIAAFAFLDRVGTVTDVPGAVLKEPLSLFAAKSPFAMVKPVNRARHEVRSH
jgi:hypothetical protein